MSRNQNKNFLFHFSKIWGARRKEKNRKEIFLFWLVDLLPQEQIHQGFFGLLKLNKD